MYYDQVISFLYRDVLMISHMRTNTQILSQTAWRKNCALLNRESSLLHLNCFSSILRNLWTKTVKNKKVMTPNHRLDVFLQRLCTEIAFRSIPILISMFSLSYLIYFHDFCIHFLAQEDHGFL